MAAEAISALEVPQSYGNDPLQQFDDFKRDEITRILLTVAATVRVIDDRESRIFDFLSFDCGSLTPDVENPESIALTIREACNKILHAGRIEVLQSEIRLTGDHQRRAWHASLDVVQSAENALRFSDFLWRRPDICHASVRCFGGSGGESRASTQIHRLLRANLPSTSAFLRTADL